MLVPDQINSFLDLVGEVLQLALITLSELLLLFFIQVVVKISGLFVVIAHLIDLDSVCILQNLGKFVVPRIVLFLLRFFKLIVFVVVVLFLQLSDVLFQFLIVLFQIIFSHLLSGSLVRGPEVFELILSIRLIVFFGSVQINLLLSAVLSWLRLVDVRKGWVRSI